VHADRASVDRCQDCGRAACLDCAVPFRGRVLCRTCAAKAVGTPDPPEPVVTRPSPGSDLVVGGVLFVALAATMLPWHRSGTLTGSFSAWRPGMELPVFLAVMALVAAIGLVAASALTKGSVRQDGAVAVLAIFAAGATAFSLLRAPDFYAFTPAPFVTLGASLVAAALSVARRRRLAPRPARVRL
jgi:hypothetical protein